MRLVWALLSVLLLPGWILDVSAHLQPAGQTRDKFLWSDLPYEVTTSTSGEFAFNFWLDPNLTKPGEQVHVYLQKNPYIKFNPEECTLESSTRCLISAKRETKGTLKDPLLVEIAANPENGWQYFSRTVSFGFVGEMKADPLNEIRSGEVKSLSLKFFDAQGKRTALKATTLLRLIGSNAKLREIGKKEWQTKPLEIWLQTGVNASPLVEVTPESFIGGEGRIRAELTSGGQYVIMSSDDVTFAAPPPEWLIFVMAILGGLLHAVYELVSGLVKKDKTVLPVASAKAIIGILSGVIAVLFADKVGIKLDVTSLTGYVALGFLVAYIGVDAVLKKTRPA